MGFNLLGPLDSTIGLANATRNTAALLASGDHPLSVFDCADSLHPLGHPHGFEQLSMGPQATLPYAIDIVHLEPNIFEARLMTDWATRPFAKRLNALVPFWELSKFPEPWVESLSSVDFVLAPTRHIESVVASAAPDVPIIHYPQSVTIPDGVVANRSRWGLGPDETVFLTSFDALSDVERKNPLASINAFRSAFPEDPGARLIVRIKNAEVDPRYAPALERVRAAMLGDPRISLVTDALAHSDALELYASVDVLVSLHRAEGLGLILMESMRLGTPVIATGWSGNMDFMTQSNSALVGYHLVPAVGTSDYYQPEYMGQGAQWAEPNLDEAAAWMRRLRDDPHLLRDMGARALADTEARENPILRLRPFEELAEFYRSSRLADPRHEMSARFIRRTQRRRALNLLKDPVALAQGVARRLGMKG